MTVPMTTSNLPTASDNLFPTNNISSDSNSASKFDLSETARQLKTAKTFSHNDIARGTTMILFFIVFLSQLSYGQTTDGNTTTQTPKELFGTWYYVYHYEIVSKDTLTFRRTSVAPRNWGQRIEINPNGEFVDADSEKCGNDEAIHHTVGKWTFDTETKILETTIPLYYKSKKNKVVALTPDSLVLVRQ